MAKLSNAVVIPAAGIVVLGDEKPNSAITIKAHPDNASTVYLGNDGNDTVTSGTGFALAASETLSLLNISDLGFIYVAGTQNDKVSWIILEV